MTITYGFYNSIDGDRKYDAKDLSSIFDGIINDGVFMSIGDHFMVTPDGDMDVLVGTGRAWFNSSWTYSDAPIIFGIEPESIYYMKRIDIIVLEVNSSEEVRANSIKIIKGIPAATNPVAPTLTNTQLIHQYPLAHVNVVGQTPFTHASITNKIGTAECPFITGILETIDSAALLAQWDDEFYTKLDYWTTIFNGWFTQSIGDWRDDFDTWFNDIKGTLGTDPATALAAALYEHKHDTMPHIFVDDGVEYHWGLSVENGVIMFNYEEV